MFITTLFGGNSDTAADNTAAKPVEGEKVIEIPAWVWNYEKSKERRNAVTATPMVQGVGQ